MVGESLATPDFNAEEFRSRCLLVLSCWFPESEIGDREAGEQYFVLSNVNVLGQGNAGKMMINSSLLDNR